MKRAALLRAASASVASVVALATGCATGGTTARDTAPPAGPLKAGVKVTLVNNGQVDVTTIFETALKEFAQKHPGITAEYVNTQGLNHLEKITTAFAAGTPYDVIRLNPGDTPGMVQRGLLRPLDDLARRDKYDLADFFEKCIDQYRWKGKLYALPRGFGNQDIYYNTSLFAAVGAPLPSYDWNARTWTTDEFLDAAQKIARRSTESGSVWGWAQGIVFRSWGPWVWNFGGEVLNKDGTACLLDQTPAVEGLQFMQDLIHRHRVMPAPAASVNAQNVFGASQLGMNLGTPSNLTTYRRLQGLTWDVAPMPRKVNRFTSGGGVAFHLAATTPHLNEAWELHKWSVSPEVQLRECAADTVAPPRKSILKHACFVDRTRPPKGIDVFLQAPEFVRSDPQAVGWIEAEELLIELFKPLWDGSKSARVVAAEAVPQVNRILQASAK